MKANRPEKLGSHGLEIKDLLIYRPKPGPLSTPRCHNEYLNEESKASVHPLIGKIRQQISTDPTLSPEYPCPFGLSEFTRRAIELALGKGCPAILEDRVLAVQTVGCAGAVRLGTEILKHWYTGSSVWHGPLYLASPSDESLAGAFEAAGVQDVRRYRYWDPQLKDVCPQKLLEDLEKAPGHSVIVLSASSHFPTGADLSQKNWRLVAETMTRRRLFPFFLMPAQGLCHGDFERDAWPVRHFAALGMELLCAQSFSHSFGLYGERVGQLLCVLGQNSALLPLRSQAELLARALWSRPPVGGARVVATVLGNPAHLVEWQEGVKRMVERCMLTRERLKEKLRLLGSPGRWDHITQQGGLYCCTGLKVTEVDFLAKKRHVYLLPNGCLNVSAINSRNLDYVAESIHFVLTSNL
ncbi:putative aspartate aminotransferase, cytoplasmic 2 [Aplochiton taeniatus]